MQLVHQNGQRLFVSSLDISNHFGRRHDDVLKAVRNLECSEKFRRRNFAETVYSRPNPSGGKGIPAPMYEITRDGFVFLCMGFTGTQAAVWKERYIEAFNQMEAALRAQYPALRQDLALACEVGHLRDQVRAQNEVILALYGRVDTAQRGHIRAVTRLLGLEKRQARSNRIETAIRMEAAGIPREEIVRVTGMSHGLLRGHIFLARRDGRLPPLGAQEGGAQ